MATGMNGSAILLKIDVSGTPKLISGQISGSHEGSADAIETTTKLSTGGAKTYIVGEHGFTMSIECKTNPEDNTNATYSDLYTAFKAKAVLSYVYGGIVAGQKTYSGECIITGISESAPQNDTETFSLSIQASGDETEDTVK